MMGVRWWSPMVGPCGGVPWWGLMVGSNGGVPLGGPTVRGLIEARDRLILLTYTGEHLLNRRPHSTVGCRIEVRGHIARCLQSP